MRMDSVLPELADGGRFRDWLCRVDLGTNLEVAETCRSQNHGRDRQTFGGDEVSKGTYACAACGETFELGWSAEEEAAEAKELWTDEELALGAVRICDPCFKRVMGDTPESRAAAIERMRRENPLLRN